MSKKSKPKVHLSITLPNTSSSDLKGKQSVRTTFKLSKRTIHAVSVVATQLGIKQKSLFDHLMDDIEALRTIAHRLQDAEMGRHSRVPKTYVLSRKSLDSLELVSKNFKTPRDALVEYSVQRLWPIIEKEQEKQEKRKRVLADLLKHFSEGETIVNKSKQLLGEDDPVSEKIAAAMQLYENSFRKIEAFIEKGKIIEEF